MSQDELDLEAFLAQYLGAEDIPPPPRPPRRRRPVLVRGRHHSSPAMLARLVQSARLYLKLTQIGDAHARDRYPAP